MLKKLNFGCGSVQPEGWDNVDKEDFGQPLVGSTDIFDDNTYDIIVAHCTIQITEWHDLPALFKELHRILKPGGFIRISLPDIQEGFKRLEMRNKAWFPNGEDEIHERFCAWLTWYSTSKSLLTTRMLWVFLERAGFDIWHPCAGETQFKLSQFDDAACELDTRENECYFFEASKLVGDE